MNGWAVASLVFIYAVSALGIINLPKTIGRSTVVTPNFAAAVVFFQVMDAIATIIIWNSNNGIHSVLLTGIAVVLIAADVLYCIQTIHRTGRTITGTKTSVTRATLWTVLWVVLISVLAFA